MERTNVATRVLREAHLNAAINVDSGKDGWNWLKQLTASKLQELHAKKPATEATATDAKQN